MQYRKIGQSGLKVSEIGLGCNNFGAKLDLEGTRAVVEKALDLGITLFDTADMYGGQGGSEKLLGEALGTKRHNIVLATKFGFPMGDGEYDKGGSRRYIMRAVEASLTRLSTDYIDLYQIHFPDPETPIEETLHALDDLVQSGKVRYIGCSNYAGWQLADAHWIAQTNGFNKFISAQNHYNLLDRKIETELVPAAQQFQVGILPYFPLASGMLTGKYRRNTTMPENSRLTLRKSLADNLLTDENFEIVEKLTTFAEDRDHTMTDLAFAWLLGHDFIPSVIAGATTPEQVEQNIAAGEWQLSAEEMAEIDRLTFRI